MERVDQNNKILDRRRRIRFVIKVVLHSKPAIMNFVAEWFSLGEMKVLQGVSVLMSVRVNEWQHKDILNDIDDLTWEDSLED